MTTQHLFPHRVRDFEHVTIAVRDGTRLAARIWLPESAADHPVPAILEYIPYRKRDGTRLRDEPMHRWFSGHGYAAVRVDLRGFGDSEGVLQDEYTDQEHQDAMDVIAWLAAQDWCDGKVGMMGKSWGGFSALQVAARRPPALKAVIAVCATDDRYADDAHYMGGCLLNENLLWGAMLMTLCAQPPDPELVGDDWRDLWRQRLAAIQAFPARWLEHPFRDAYWRRGSIREDFAAVQVPVWTISGWADGYSNAVLRLLEGLECPRWGLIGPWAHVYPHEGVPGPAVGFLQEATRFWDRWLRGTEDDGPAEPLLRAFLEQGARPAPDWPDRAGRWVAEDQWPSPRIEPRIFALGQGRLLPPADAPEPAPALVHSSLQSVGVTAGSWCAFGLEGENPGDQRDDDARSLCFDSAPLVDPLELLGAPQVELTLAVDRPAALICARLCEVFPDGTSARVSYGLLNLTHRGGHQSPVPMEPGEEFTVCLALNDLAHAFRPGNRLRLGLSTSCWPMAWPSPRAATLTLLPARCRLILPVRPPRPEDDALPPMPPPKSAPKPPYTDLHRGGLHRAIRRDPVSGDAVHETTLDLEADGTPSLTRLDDIDLLVGHGMRETFTIRDDDPLSARAEVLHETVTRRGDWEARVSLRATLSSDDSKFHFAADLVARENGVELAHRHWRCDVPRRCL